MTTTAAQQVALDNALKEPTYQVVLDALALTTYYPSFLIIVDVLEIYMQQFWFTINKKDSTTYKFKIDKKSYRLIWKYSEKSFRYVLDFQIKTLMNSHQMMKLSPSLRNLDTKETLNLSLKWSLIRCTNHGELLHLSSTSAYLGKLRVLTSSEFLELKFYGECSIRRRSDDFQVYGALLPKRMTNQQMRDSNAYKTYLAYATGKASPKMKRKLKKPASPSKKITLVTKEEEEPEPTKKKKAPTKAERSKGIELLSDAALLEEAQLKKALKRSKRDTNIHQVGGSSEGADSESEVPDEPKGKLIDTSKRPGLKPGVPNVSKCDSSESEYESWGNSGDNNDDDNDDDEEEKQDDEFVHTLDEYVPTDNETNDEYKEFDKEEYEELYGDVNISLKDADTADKEKGDVEMTNTETGPIPSSSISSDDAAKYLNFDNIPLVDTEVVSVLDINVQHEVPRTSPLLTIPVSVIPEHTVANPSEIVTTASSTTISSLLSSLFPYLQQLTLIPTPTTTEATTSTIAVSEYETLSALHQSVTDLEKDVKELKTINHSAALLSTIKSKVPNAVKDYLGTSLDDALHKILQKHSTDITKEHSVPVEIVERLKQQYVHEKSTKDIRKIKMKHTRKQQEPKETITSYDTTALTEFNQKTTLFETMTKSKSFNKSLKQRALYHALMESILEDEDAMDKGVADKLKKRKHDDADKEEGHSAGLDRGFRYLNMKGKQKVENMENMLDFHKTKNDRKKNKKFNSVATSSDSNSSLVCRGPLNSVDSYSVGNVSCVGFGTVEKESLLYPYVQNHPTSCVGSYQVNDASSTSSAYVGGGVVLDFENSSVQLSCGKKVVSVHNDPPSCVGSHQMNTACSVKSASVGGGVDLDFEKSSVKLPCGKQLDGVSYFGSGFRQHPVTLDFQKSAVVLPSAKDSLTKPGMFNDGIWSHKHGSKSFLPDDRFDHIFRLEEVQNATRLESPIGNIQRKVRRHGT
ncbi:hypothetical protein Tco_0412264 [Tanacetum coccineum]